LIIHRQWHPELLFTRTVTTGSSYWPQFLLATLLGSWALVGFESAADMAEETINSRRNVPRAILGSLLLSIVMGFAALVTLTLAIPDLLAVTKSDTPIIAIFEYYWGHNLSAVFMATVAVSILSCGMVGMTSASRLLYAMARDDVFPAARFFRHVSSAGIPWRAVGLIYIVDILLELFSDRLTSLFTASSILFALVYLITVLAYAVKAKSLPPIDSFSLQRGRYALIGVAIVWLIAELAILIIPEDFHKGALAAGAVCLSGIALYAAVYRRKLTRL
jgi:amino acid transporter